MSSVIDSILGHDEKETLKTMMDTLASLDGVNKNDIYYFLMKILLSKDDNFFDTYQVLIGIGRSFAPKRILEIGSRTGTSLCQLLLNHSDLERIDTIICVDPFTEVPGSSDAVQNSVEHFNIDIGYDIYKVKSSEFYEANIETFDYILIDGSHKAKDARKDLEECHKIIEKGGIIVFDDICLKDDAPLINVWDAWKIEHKGEYEFREIMRGQGTAIALKL